MFVYRLISEHDEDGWVILDHEMPDEVREAYEDLGYEVSEAA